MWEFLSLRRRPQSAPETSTGLPRKTKAARRRKAQPGYRPRVESLESRIVPDGVTTTIAEEQWPGNDREATAYYLGLSWGGVNCYVGPQLWVGDRDYYLFSTLRPPEDGDSAKVTMLNAGSFPHLVRLSYWNGTQFQNVNHEAWRFTLDAASNVSVSLNGLNSTFFLIDVSTRTGFSGTMQYRVELDVPPIKADALDEAVPNNNTLATATDLGTVSGFQYRDLLTIHDHHDVDYFRFTLPQGASDEHYFAIDFEHSPLTDLGLELTYDNDSSIILDKDVGPSNRHEVSLANLPAGTYRLLVREDGGRPVTSPRYRLSWNAPRVAQADSFEANDTFAAATDLQTVQGVVRRGAERNVPNGSSFLSIHSPTDKDNFKFTINATGTVADFVQIDLDHTAGDLDLLLYSGQTSPFLLNSSVGASNTERISLDGLPAGTYHAVIQGAAGATNPSYALSVRGPGGSAVTDQYDATTPNGNNNRNRATHLGPIGGLRLLTAPDVTLSIDPNDEDWFAFELLQTAGPGHFVATSSQQSLGDLDVQLYNGNGNVLRSSTGNDDGEYLNLAGLAAGTYFVRVYGLNGASNPQYGLAINGSGPDRYDELNPNNTAAAATNLRTVSGRFQELGLSLHSSTDQDWFRFQTAATAGTNHQISLDFQHAQGDLNLSLYDANGSQLLASSEGVSNGERIDLTDVRLPGGGRGALPAGTYTIEVAGQANATNPLYHLTLVAPSSGGADRYDRGGASNNSRTAATDLRAFAAQDGTPGGRITIGDAESPLSIHAASDEDWFRIALSGRETASHFAAISFDHTQGDLDLELYRGSDTTPLRRSVGVGNRHVLDLTNLSAADNYSLRVFGYNGGAGAATNPAYTLVVDLPETVSGDWLESRPGAADNNVSSRATDLGTLDRALERAELSIHNGADEDWFRFQTLATGGPGHAATIAFDHLQGDLELDLYNASVTLLRRSATVNNQESVLLDELPAGTYFLRVVGRGTGSTRASNPRYALRIDPPVGSSGDYAEPNNASSAPFDLREVRGARTFEPLSIHTAGNDDWFRFTTTGTASDGHAVRIGFDPRLGDLDLFLYDAAGARLLGEARTAQGTEEIGLNAVNLTSGTGPLPAGTYLLRVAGHQNSTNPRYLLSLDVPDAATPPDFAEPNDTTTQAANLQRVEGATALSGFSIHQAADQDWFVFQTTALGVEGHRVEIAFDHAEGDLQLALFSSTNPTTPLEQSQGVSNREVISLAGRPAGTYYVRVSGTGSTTNPSYGLTVAAPQGLEADFADRPTDNNSRSQAYPLRTIEGALSLGGLSIHTATDQDWYQFNLPRNTTPGQAARIDFNHAEGNLKLELFRGSDPAPFATSDGSGNFEEVALRDAVGNPLLAGTYYVRVSGSGGATNPDYSLSINTTPAVQADRYEPNDSLASAYDLRDVSQARGAGSASLRDFGFFSDFTSFAFPSGGFGFEATNPLFYDLSGGLNSNYFPGLNIGFGNSLLGSGPIPAWGFLIDGGAFGNFAPDLLFSGNDGSGFFNPYGFNPQVSPGFASFAFPSGGFGFEATNPLFYDLSGGLNSNYFPGLNIGFGNSLLGSGPIPAWGFLIDGGAFGNFAPDLLFSGNDGSGFFNPYGFNSFGFNSFGFFRGDAAQSVVSFDGLSLEAGDPDYFRFELTRPGQEGQFVGLGFDHNQGDLKLTLLTWSGNAGDPGTRLDSSNGQGNDERISLAGLPDGAYYVLVEGATASVSNPNYQLLFNTSAEVAATGDLAESNDTAATAHDLRVVEGDRQLSGLSIHTAADQDWFRFEITSATTAANFARIDFDQDAGDLDLELYRSTGGSPMRVSRTTGDTEEVALLNESGQPLARGAYLLHVVGYGNATNPRYDLRLHAPLGSITPDALEPNNTASRAVNLNTLNVQRLPGLTIHAGDEDYFQFTVPAGRTLNQSHALNMEFDATRGDLNLTLLNSSGGTVLRTPATANTGNEIIALDGLTAGTYLVRVAGANASTTNRYTLYVDAPLPLNQSGDDWTVLVYMTASDLAPFAFEDINEMEAAAAALPGSVNLAVLYDQSSAHQKFATGGGTQAAWGTTGRAIIRPDTDADTIATPFDLSIGEKNTGNPTSLVEFLTWTTSVAPASNYALILWDHGAGVEGFNFDNADGAAADAMTAGELVSALQQVSGFRLDLLAFDSCNMAMTELADRFAPLAEVVVASEENIPGTGYAYDTIFASLVANPDLVGPAALASGFVESYENLYRGNAEGADTLSAVRSSALGTLTTALRTFTTAALAAGVTTAQFDVLRDARDSATSFLGHPEYRDLGQFMSFAAAASTLPASVRSAAQGVLDALTGAVIARTSDQRETSGLSLLLPAHGEAVTADYTSQFATFLTTTGWGTFLQQFVSGPTARPASLDPDLAEANEQPQRAYDLHTLSGRGHGLATLSLHNRTDRDFFRFRTLAAGTAADQVTLTRDTAVGSWRVSLHDPQGVERDQRTGTGTSLTLPLSGRAAGTYLVRIASTDGTLVPRYSLQIDAPSAAPGNDWAGSNSTAEKASDLGVIGSDALYSGLVIEPGQTDWFAFQTPRNVSSGTTQGRLQVVSTTGQALTVQVQKGQDTPTTRTGNGTVALPFDTGTAFDYRLSVTGAAGDSYQIQFLADAQPGQLQFSAGTYSLAENGGQLDITVQRVGGSDSQVTVNYATSNGTAAAGSDYTSTSGTLTFAAGETSKTFGVTILDDTAVENNETVTLTLSNPTGGAALGSPQTATLTILDNDTAGQPGQLQFSTAASSANEAAGSVPVTVTRTGGSSGTVSIRYATSDGTATAGQDYTAVSGTLTFGPGETSKTFAVPVADDTADEDNETVALTLSSPTGGATLGTPDRATLTIADNDTPSNPSELRFSVTAFQVSENVGDAVVTVLRTGSNARTVTVQYTTADGTARAGLDYTAASGVLTLPAGALSTTFRIPILSDSLTEGEETIALTLSNPGAGAVLITPTSATLTLNDPLTVDPYPANLGVLANELTHDVESYSYFIKEAYRLYLKRLPDANGLAFWVDLMKNHGVTDEQLEAFFLGSLEYIANHGGTGQGWVIGMYQDLLGRDPDGGGLAFWTAQLAAGASPVAIAYGFAASAEREAQRITTDYQLYLGRDLDQGGLNFWVGVFLRGATNEDVVGGFVGSQEYYASPKKGQANQRRWIESAFQDVFHREPTEAEISLWLSRMG